MADVPVVAWHAKAARAVDDVVRQIGSDQWDLPTPCGDWNVRELVRHLVTEARWTPPLLDGLTIEEAAPALDGDLIGDDPLGAWESALAATLKAADGPTVENGITHLSMGDTPAQEYLHQLTADYLIHGWDLKCALGVDDRMDPDLLAMVSEWFAAHQAEYLAAGVIDPPAATAPDADDQVRLLAMYGRDARSATTAAAVGRFNAAFARHDVDAVMAAMTDDCEFENTSPQDGTRYVGQAAVRQAWTDFFAASGSATFQTEEEIVCGDRVIARWRYTWGPEPDDHVRGVDLFRVRDRLVAEKVSYVKG